MNHYHYRSTTSNLFYDSAPDPFSPPGGGWEYIGQSSIVCGSMKRMIWTWRQVSFVTPGKFTDQFKVDIQPKHDYATCSGCNPDVPRDD